MVKIVKASAADFEAFYTLFKKNLQNGSYLYPVEKALYVLKDGLQGKAKLKKDIVRGKFPLYVAYQNSEISGYFLTEKTFAGVAFGYWLGVDKKHQNQGIGSKLLSVWEAEVLKKGAHSIFLWTTENNIKFYKKRGFTLGGTFPKSWFSLTHFLFYKHLK